MTHQKIRIAIAASEFNKPVTDALLHGALQVLEECGIEEVQTFWCPGAFELPLVAKSLAEDRVYDAIICLGAVIRGETYHFEVISDTVTRGLMEVMLETRVPVALGVLTPYTGAQALVRSDPTSGNKGAEAARAAVAMVRLLREIRQAP